MSTKTAKYLVIVESPTKAKTISKILGEEFSVVSCMGHIIDLPEKELGINIENDFQPSYVVVPNRKKIISIIKKEAKGKEVIYIATDPDREGEAIGWHLSNYVLPKHKIKRVVFHEITPAAVKAAFSQARDFDQYMIEAQASRRIMDRIVGYFLSPLLWRKVARGLSAGRVQSVALRLIVERERQIKNFIPREYWEIEAELKRKEDKEKFVAKLSKIDGQKPQIENQKQAESIISDLQGKIFEVVGVNRKEKSRYPEPPFITSTLQQEAFNRFHYNATKTMIIAQRLYEGIDIGQDSPVGLITYMRTDSPRLAPEAIQEARRVIVQNFGQEYVPEKPNEFKVKKMAQQAHEAIRPTLINRSPESLKDFLTPDEYKLYELIYNRFIASQMSPARYLVTSVEIQADRYLFNASGSTVIFDGFSRIYQREENNENGHKDFLPQLQEKEKLDLISLLPSQHFTKPPARYSDSSLIKAMEEEGIGRPSTYAPTIATLILRDYVRRIKGYLYPTELGFKINDLLVAYFPKILDLQFTASMEEKLDEVEEGRLARLDVLRQFYPPFKESLDFAQANIKKEIITTEDKCDKCGSPMIIKWGKKGKFLSCSNYPQCKNSKSISSGVVCPETGCGGYLVERHSRRGFFFGCSNYPKCKYVSRTLPENKDSA